MATIHSFLGDQDLFAIECNVFEPIDPNWIFGNFRFWLRGITLGNWNDTTSLFGCANWLQEFIDTPMNRYEPGLLSLPKQEVFNLLLDNVKWETREYQPYPNVYGRFHISHLGMSAFDQYDILLVENQEQQRVLWRQGGDSTIYETYFPGDEIQRVVKLFLDWFRNRISDNSK